MNADLSNVSTYTFNAVVSMSADGSALEPGETRVSGRRHGTSFKDVCSCAFSTECRLSSPPISKGTSMHIRNTVLLAAVLLSGLFAADGASDMDNTSPPPAQFSPLTSHERLGNYVSGLGSLEAVVRSAASAGIAQAGGTPKEWGGGAEGFGYRIGNAFAQHVIRDTVQYGISATLHEDNRYFVSGETGFFRRTKYALRSTFLARHDNGSQSFSFSRIGGAASTAFISRAWQPTSKTTAGDGAVVFGFSMMTDIGFNVAREFLPDLKRRFHKH
jgi:hypothetical protein